MHGLRLVTEGFKWGQFTTQMDCSPFSVSRQCLYQITKWMSSERFHFNWKEEKKGLCIMFINLQQSPAFYHRFKKCVSSCSQSTNTVLLLRRVLEDLSYLKPRWKAVRAHRPAGGESSVHSLLTKCPSATMHGDRPHLSVKESFLSDVSAWKRKWIVGMYIHVDKVEGLVLITF